MSSEPQQERTAAEGRSSPQNIPNRPQEEVPSSTPLELNSLKNDTARKISLSREETRLSQDSAKMPPGPSRVDTSTAIQQSLRNPPSTPPSVPAIPAQAMNLTAIGPSSDKPAPVHKDSESSGPTLLITLLLTNGARHPFKLDPKYLQRRSVNISGNDPYELSVYKLKELILREWREEWEAKPSSPSAIRLISFGKLLDDKSPLKGRPTPHKLTSVIS